MIHYTQSGNLPRLGFDVEQGKPACGSSERRKDACVYIQHRKCTDRQESKRNAVPVCSGRKQTGVIDTHANYDKLTTNDGPDNGISLFRGTHLTAPKFNLMARIVILLGCNAGHYDHRYENIAYYIAQKLPYGIVVASDGTVSSSMKPNQRVHYDSIVDDNWKKQRKVMYYTQLGMYQSGYIRPKNKGWLIYKRTWAEPFETGI